MSDMTISKILKNYPRNTDEATNFEASKKILTENYSGQPEDVLLEVLNLHLKKHFKLTSDSVTPLKKLIERMVKETAKKSKEVKKEEKEQVAELNSDIREKRDAKIKEIYETLCNKSGKSKLVDIECAKTELKEIMMGSFWDIEGMNIRTGNPGHLSLKKLPIADYISKSFNLVKFGGRLWRYDWSKAFYTYDADDSVIHQEIVDIIKKVGDGDFYRYNGHSISDKACIIDLAGNDRVYTENPFNKHSGYINTKNGVLKLDYEKKTVTRIGKKPEYMFSYCIDSIYDPEVVDTAIDEMLVQNLGRRQADQIYQMAAIAIRDTDPKLIPSKIAYLMVGPRNTGKNVVMQTISEFFGSAIVSRIPLIELATNKFVKPLLEGKVINLDDEVPENLPLTESREIKSLTGGKFHTLEPKNVKPYNGIISALLVFAGNQFPKCSISKNDTAFWDRWEILEFKNKQHKVDEKYLTNLLTPHNLSGFLNRVIRKLFEIHDNGIKRIWNDGESTYRKWMYESSSVYRFMEDMTVKVGVVKTYSKAEFFDNYTDWCSKVGIDIHQCKNLQEFGMEMNKVNASQIKEFRACVGNARVQSWQMMREYRADRINNTEDLSNWLPDDNEESTDKSFSVQVYWEDDEGRVHGRTEKYEVDEYGNYWLVH